MKVIELLKMGSEMLKLMSQCDVSVKDWKYVKMYHEFIEMRRKGIKYRSCVSTLANDYRVSRATIERAIKRLSKEC